jgi:hypothetical protein
MQYQSPEEMLAKVGLSPNRDKGQRGIPMLWAA